MTKQVTILTGDPTIIVLAETNLSVHGIESMMDWVQAHRPECLPEREEGQLPRWDQLFPHDLTEPSKTEGASIDDSRHLTHNELLVELAGRTCYASFGLKAGRKTNSEYIKNMQAGDVPHASVLYHAKMTFFFAGISRRVSHELIRNYVGADRDEEGSPSQESTRFTHHYGFFIEPPKYSSTEFEYASQSVATGLSTTHNQRSSEHFRLSMQQAYNNYLAAVEEECTAFEKFYGKKPTSIDKKRIYEAASSFLPHQAETSFLWTTNPMWIAKFCKERAHAAADLEMWRFARKLKRISVERWPNLFPQPHMRETT